MLCKDSAIYLILRPKYRLFEFFYKKNSFSFGKKKKYRTFASAKAREGAPKYIKANFGVWCNGNTTDSGPVILGSNPSTPTKRSLKQSVSEIFLLMDNSLLRE